MLGADELLGSGRGEASPLFPATLDRGAYNRQDRAGRQGVMRHPCSPGLWGVLEPPESLEPG